MKSRAVGILMMVLLVMIAAFCMLGFKGQSKEVYLEDMQGETLPDGSVRYDLGDGDFVIEPPSEPAQPDLGQPAATPAEPSATPAAKGTVKTFEYGELTLEVSNVKEIGQGSCFDGMENWEYDVYVVYPEAVVKVLNADTFIDEETNLPHASWAFLMADDKRIDIMDGMEPLEITGEVLGVYDTESSLYVLAFEMSDE